MNKTHRLLDGQAAVIDVPDAADLPGGISIGVLSLEGAGEMEVTGGRESDLAFFLEVTGTTLDREVGLRDGRTLRHGRFGGDPDQGFGWAIELDQHRLYGFTLPVVDIEGLTGFLAEVDVQVDTLGPVLTPTGRVGWSPYRTQKVAQVVELTPGGVQGEGGAGYLLDTRRAKGGITARRETGLQVRGGLLTRSPETDQHRYGILEGTDFVTYGLPGTDEHVDAVLTSLSEAAVELGR